MPSGREALGLRDTAASRRRFLPRRQKPLTFAGARAHALGLGTDIQHVWFLCVYVLNVLYETFCALMN